MDAISDPAVREIWCMKGAQIGWTDILLNAIGYFAEQDPSPQLMIQPTLDMGEAFSKDRFAPAVRDTERLRAIFKDPKSRDSGNTLLHKQYPGGHVTIAGANSAASLASRPIRIVLCDEIDRYPVSAGTEGDPIRLAQKRSATFWNRRFLAGSTPTVQGASRIEIGFNASDKRRFFVPCPHCAEMQVLKWQQVRWPKGEPEKAAYACPHCGGMWDDAQRRDAVRRGEWRATAPFSGVAGFHIWEAYSPWRRLAEIVTDFVAAEPHRELLKVWVNTSLGETWEERDGERMQAADLAERAEDYERWTVPAGAAMATAGVDVQHDRLEVGVYAYGPGEECWTVAHEVIYKSPKDADAWSQLDELLAQPVRRDDGMALPIAATCVDASDGQTTGFVLDYCRARRQRNVLAIKGQPHGKPPIGRPTKVDINVRGRALQKGAELWPVGVDTIKGILHARLQDEGFIHFPDGLEPAYFEQMTAERLITKFRNGVPRKVWEKKSGERNEAWDCAIYAYAAACFYGLKRANWKALGARLRPARDEASAEMASVPRPVHPPRMIRPKPQGFGNPDWNL